MNNKQYYSENKTFLMAVTILKLQYLTGKSGKRYFFCCSKFKHFCRKIPLQEVNIINILISYNIEIVNLNVATLCIPVLVVIHILPWPFIVAEAWILIYHILACNVCALGTAISALQILYVLSFNIVFAWNPIVAGRRIMVTIFLIVSIPSLTFGIFFIRNGIHIGPMVVYFARLESQTNFQSVSFFAIHLAFWALLSTGLFISAFVVIPFVMKSEQAGSWKRYLAGFLGVGSIFIMTLIINVKQTSQQVPIQVYVMTIFWNTVLAFHLSGHDVKIFGHRYLMQLFKMPPKMISKFEITMGENLIRSQSIPVAEAQENFIMDSYGPSLSRQEIVEGSLKTNAFTINVTPINDD